VNGSNYDAASVMIYSFPQSVACNDESVNLTLDGMRVDPTYKLSNGDIQWLQYMYPKSGVRDPNLSNYPKDIPFTAIYDPESFKNGLKILKGFAQENPMLSGSVLLIVVLLILKVFIL
jgi:hypothetical protein